MLVSLRGYKAIINPNFPTEGNTEGQRETKQCQTSCEVRTAKSCFY